MAKIKKMQAGGKATIQYSSPDSLYKSLQLRRDALDKDKKKFEEKYNGLKSKFQEAKTQMEKSKKKMQAGGVTKSVKRVGPVDPNGAYTKVQERNLPPVNMKTSVSLKKDKELDASAAERKQAGAKMKNGGKLGSGARFAALKSKIQSKGGKSAKAAGAIAASIGRKKYGAKKMTAMAVAGRKKAK